jgi:hypothetical protein
MGKKVQRMKIRPYSNHFAMSPCLTLRVADLKVQGSQPTGQSKIGQVQKLLKKRPPHTRCFNSNFLTLSLIPVPAHNKKRKN